MVSELFYIVQGLSLVFVVIAAPTFAGGWVLIPLDRAAKLLQANARFTLIDFFGLFFLVQMPMALVHGLVPRSDSFLYWTLMVLSWIASGLVWLTAISTFSKAGIERASTRATLVFFVMPMAYFAPFAVTIMVMVMATSYDTENRVLLTVISMLLCVGIVAAGLATRRIARPLIARVGNPFDADDLA